MKFATAHQPSCYVGRLQQRALGWKMGSQIPRDGNKNMTALFAVAPLVKLPYPCLEHRGLAQANAGRGDKILYPKQRSHLTAGCDQSAATGAASVNLDRTA